MAQPSRAHVKIGDHEFELAQQTGSGASTFLAHYKHTGSTLLANRQDITGRPGRQNIRPEILFFAQDSWSGGQGQKFYDPNLVKKYYRGTGNPRVDGLLASTPTRTDTDSPTGDVMVAPVYAAGGGFIYMVNSDDVPVGHTCVIYQSDDLGVTWVSAELHSSSTGTPSWNRNIACDQNGNAYVVLGNPQQINRIERVTTALVSDDFHLETTHATLSHLGARGAAVHEHFLYVWTGIKLYQWDIAAVKTGAPPAVDVTMVGSLGRDDLSVQIATADIVNCGDGVAMFTSQPGRSGVYQYRRTVQGNATPAFSQLWQAPPDVILWSIAAQDGFVYVAGNQDSGVTVWAINLANNQVAPVARITPDQDAVDA